ncbi:hypothetical protein IFM89_026877 [Coptis chinensis]|uniref:Uncharacterized protein n=1 Tax=Coptis chinensis TaxID=261450 RepID=A0A835LGM8_9MAGN|nr:hypothetical protein IFM89_026877 [Coptis chinensis]
MRLAWQVAKHAIDASGFGLSFNKETKRIDADENAWESYVKGAIVGGFDDDMVDGDDSRQTQGDGGDDSDASESSAFGAPSDTGGDTSQTESGPRSTTPTSKKTTKSRFFEDIPEPPSFKSLPDMNPELFLRSLDLLVENDRLIKVFLGLKEDIKASWLFRRLEQAGR